MAAVFLEVAVVEVGEVNRLKEALGGNLLCVAEYGFEDGQGRMPGAIAVIRRMDQRSVEQLAGLKLAPFAILSAEEIANARDSLPLYFLEVKNNYRVLCGKDVFAPLAIARKTAKAHLEQELRIKLIYLRQGLAFNGSRHVVDRAPAALAPALAGLLFLKGKRASSFKQAIAEVERDYSTGTKVFETVYEKRGSEGEAAMQLWRFLSKLIEAVEG